MQLVRMEGVIIHFIFSSMKLLLIVVVTDTHNDKEVKTRLNECNNLKWIKKKLKRIIDMKTYRYVSGNLWTEKMFWIRTWMNR